MRPKAESATGAHARKPPKHRLNSVSSAKKQRGTRTFRSQAEEECLVVKLMPLVKTILGRISLSLPHHVDHEDLYSAGLVGLLQAIRNFNPCGGSSLETYARLRIRGAIFDELRRMHWVPRSVHTKARRVQSVMSDLEQRSGGVPSEMEMAKALNISLGAYQDLLTEIRPATFICLDSVQDFEEEGSGLTQYEAIADLTQETPLETTGKRELTELIGHRLRQLPAIQRKVLALYYFEGLRLREIAEAFGLTESRICQIHAQAILGIKSYFSRIDQLVPERIVAICG